MLRVEDHKISQSCNRKAWKGGSEQGVMSSEAVSFVHRRLLPKYRCPVLLGGTTWDYMGQLGTTWDKTCSVSAQKLSQGAGLQGLT